MDPGDSDQEDPLYLDLARGPDIIHIDTHTHRVYPLEGIGYVETTNLKEQALQHTTMVAEPVLRIIMSTLRIRYQFNTEDNSFMLLTPVTDAIRAIQLLAQHHKRGTKYKKIWRHLRLLPVILGGWYHPHPLLANKWEDLCAIRIFKK